MNRLQSHKFYQKLILTTLIVSLMIAMPLKAHGAPAPQANLGYSTYLPLIQAFSRIQARTINIPYFGADAVVDQHYDEMSIFWFGKVSLQDNYSDVRIGFNSQEVEVHLSIFDRLLWYDPTPSAADLTAWDAVTVYLSKDYSQSAQLSQNDFRFTGQLNNGEVNRSAWQLAEQGSATGWKVTGLPFSTATGIRWGSYTEGGVNNDKNNRGWAIDFKIPFSSLGLSTPPSIGSDWKMAVVLYDRDNASGTDYLVKTWPEAVQPTTPKSWGHLHFGLPTFNRPPPSVAGTTIIRNKLNGAIVPDSAMGGTTGNLCPGDTAYIWNDWGNVNYGLDSEFNIQNQSDLGDWPCFAKYYITFPLTQLPPGRVILSATLTLHQWGNSGALSGWNQGQRSYIHVFTVTDDWVENLITWNNAPIPQENVSQAWVDMAPPCGGPGELTWPCTPRSWDVSRALQEAYQSGQPLRLALYSSDSAYHSGKFFTSSNVDDWDATGRPQLTVTWGNP